MKLCTGSATHTSRINMLAFKLALTNPWSKTWKTVWVKHCNTPFKHKYLEIEVSRTNDVLAVDLRFTARQDHAGIALAVGLLGLTAQFMVYDSRHWPEGLKRYDE